jgi:predicted RNase H-like HicB family nuclease
MANYTAVFEQAADGSWGGYVPDLPVVVASGETLEEAQQNMREGIEIWIEEAKRSGEPIPAAKSQASVIEVAA